ncbi:AraC family transcriptional regulator [Rhodalgimonas zhirmunskyi]|nr:helix-turn-helix domain-containing protein [Rhodoalgimonas zhirmunskyi]
MHSQTPETHPLARLMAGGAWRLGLHHAREDHLVIWLTKGQGLATLRGLRQGLTVHNALFIPAGTLFSIDPGPQGFGIALVIPGGCDIPLPGAPRHLRVRDAQKQNELFQLLEAMGREQSRSAAGGANAYGEFHAQAARAYATLISVWLRRMSLDLPANTGPTPEQHLSARFSDLVARNFRSGKAAQAYAAELDVPPDHLNEAVQTCSGLTPTEMLSQTALHAARLMIEDGTLPFTEIAAHLGFASPQVFTRFIQSRTGKSPTQLRNAAPDQPAP